MKKLIKIPYYFLVFGVVAIGLLILATLMPIPGNFKVKIVRSGSMEPAIKTGGIVVIHPAVSYGVGDVVTFGKDTKTQIPTTHRIIKDDGGVFTTMGDANDAPDPSTIRTGDIGGKVVFSVPYLGYILDFAKKPLGFALIVGIPAILVIFDELAKIWKEIQKIRRKKTLHKEETNYMGVNVLDLRTKQKERLEQKNPLRFRMNILSALLIFFAPLAGLYSVGSTVSYYRESESSVSNLLQVGTDFPVKTFNRVLGASISDPETLLPAEMPDEEITEPEINTDIEEPPAVTDEEEPPTKDEPLIAEEEEAKKEGQSIEEQIEEENIEPEVNQENN